MAAGTRGRQLKDGARWLRIHGADVPVRAFVAEAAGLSGHAGRSELLRWLSKLPAPRQVYLTHGEKAVEIEPQDTFNWTALSTTYQRAFEGTQDRQYIYRAEDAKARSAQMQWQR